MFRGSIFERLHLGKRRRIFHLMSCLLLIALFSGSPGCNKMKEMADNASEAFQDAKEKISDRVNDRGTKEKKDDYPGDDTGDGSSTGTTTKLTNTNPPEVKKTPQQKWEAFQKIQSNRITDRTIQELADDPEAAKLATEMVLSSARITVNALNALSSFPNLKSLTMKRVKCLTGNMNYIGRLAQLEVLDISNNQLGDPDFLELKPLVNLRILLFEELNITDEAFMAFKDMPKIEVLTMHECRSLLGKGFKYVNKNNLVSVNANDTRIGQFAFDSIGGAPKLKVLWLNRAGVTLKAMTGIARCGELRELHLFGNDLNNDCIKKLQRHKKLEEIFIRFNPKVSNPSLGALTTIKTLKIVDVQQTACDPNLKADFLKRLPDCDIRF